VRLSETDDEAADQARLNEVLRLVSEAPGDSPALLTVVGVSEEVILELPSCSPRWALVEALSRALGDFGAAEIEPLPVPAPAPAPAR